MLSFTKDGEIGFRQYTKDTKLEHNGIEITQDLSGRFARKFFRGGSMATVNSLYHITATVLINNFTAIIKETAQKRIALNRKGCKKVATKIQSYPRNSSNVNLELKIERKISNEGKINPEFWTFLPMFLKDSLPSEILEEIEKGVLNQLKKTFATPPPYEETVKYLHWKLFFPIIQTSTHLKLTEFLSWDDCYDDPFSSPFSTWSGLAFLFLTNETEDAIYMNEKSKVFQEEQKKGWNFKLSKVKKLTLGTCGTLCSKYGFKYEVNENEWKTRLSRLLKKLPNLSEINLLNGFCDDDVICLVGKYCNRLTVKRIRICCAATECADPERLTDEGMCEFIDRYSGTYGLEGDSDVPPAVLTHLDLSDCHYPNITAKTLSNLGKLKYLKRVDLRLMHFQWGELFDLPMKTFDQNNISMCTANVLSLSVGQTSVYHQNDVRDNKGEEILERFDHVLKLFPGVRELHLREVYCDKSYKCDPTSPESHESEATNAISKMATSLKLFNDSNDDANFYVVKSLHLVGGFVPLWKYNNSDDGSKILKHMALIKSLSSLHLQNFHPHSWVGNSLYTLKSFKNITKIFISYGFGYTFLSTFPLKIVIENIFESTKSLEDLQMTNLKEGKTTLLEDKWLRDLIEDQSNSRIKNNLRVFVLNVDTSEELWNSYTQPDTKLGLTLENSAIFLQKTCPNIQRIGCLNSWSTIIETNKDKSTDPNSTTVSLERFLLPNFKLVRTSRSCECLENFDRPCCIQVSVDLTRE